jgi:NADH-quinone oxidoreductase subunit E
MAIRPQGEIMDENLIEILQKAQETHGWLSPETLEKISEEHNIKPAKIAGVVSFYTQFRTKPAGKNLILLCQGTACHVNGSAEIEAAIRDFLGAGEDEITADGKFTYSNVACLGCCSLAPAMIINGKTFGKLTRESVVEILSGY